MTENAKTVIVLIALVLAMGAGTLMAANGPLSCLANISFLVGTVMAWVRALV